ncbi:MAG: IclR family transcriptional regulator, partial [Paracoccus sp. (in: a-proteobacteria)]
LLRTPKPMTLAEIADTVGLDHSTCLRLMRSLEDLRQVLRLDQGKKYICSPKALSPLPLLHPLKQIRRESASIFYKFAAEVGATLGFVISLGTERMVVQVATSAGTLNPYYNAWLDGPLHGSGPGKAYLMSLSPAERRRAVGPEPFAAFTPRTLRSWSELEADLARAEARGYALVHDEY